MFLCVLLAWAIWGSESLSIPMKITTSSHKNHTAICAEIEKELKADEFNYTGFYSRPQNASKEPCYGEFTKNFISTLRNVTEQNKNDCHIKKVYVDLKELTKICTKLNSTELSKNCTIEQSSFSQFKDALRRVVLSIQGWKSCNSMQDGLWDTVLSQKPATRG